MGRTPGEHSAQKDYAQDSSSRSFQNQQWLQCKRVRHQEPFDHRRLQQHPQQRGSQKDLARRAFRIDIVAVQLGREHIRKRQRSQRRQHPSKQLQH